ncbi:hypothetical protein [Bordetella genomosp. 13]|uniref:hypothetical protein n=1 Tax=Bordetella genomosp. 13 TaxID=463040 RepID=UPI0011A3072A|nr:hypothetical protein [Bordetella genomosp. 13]
MPRPYTPHRDAGIPTLTQRAEPTLSPDAVLPRDDDTPVLGDIYLAPREPSDDIPVLSQPADDPPEPPPGTAAALPPHSYLELGPSEPYTPVGDRAGRLPPHAPLRATGPLADHPAKPYPLDSGPPYTARPQMPDYQPTAPAEAPQAPPRYVPPVHPGLEPDLSPAPAASAPSTASASIPEAVLRAALQAEIEQAVQAAVQEASVLLRTRLEAELPAIVARTLGRVRPG